MTNVKISEKGRALLNNGPAAAKVAMAIVNNHFDSNGQMIVQVGNSSLTISKAGSGKHHIKGSKSR